MSKVYEFVWMKHIVRLFALLAVTLFVGGIVPLESVSPAFAAGPTKCQPGWSALVHKVYSTVGNMPDACANTACWPVTWEMTKTYPGSGTPDCWILGTCQSTSFMYRTMAAAQGSWQSLPQCPSSVTGGPWHAP